MRWLDPILRPLAYFAIRKGWLFKDVSSRLKRAYVGAALDLCDDDATDSRISVMTGLQRRDVAALREASETPPRRQPLAEILSLWWSDPAYPIKGLPIQGDGASFSSLARSIRQDVHPRTFLDLLVENGAVVESGGHVALKARTYKPSQGSEEQLAYLAENVGDHFATAVANVTDGQNRYDMAVHYSGLSEHAIAELDALFRSRMRDVLRELDTAAREFPAKEDGPFRFRAGGYFFDQREKVNSHDP